MGASPTLPLTHVTSAASTRGHSDSVDTSPKVDTWDPSSQRDGTGSTQGDYTGSTQPEGTVSAEQEGSESEVVEEEVCNV